MIEMDITSNIRESSSYSVTVLTKYNDRIRNPSDSMVRTFLSHIPNELKTSSIYDQSDWSKYEYRLIEVFSDGYNPNRISKQSKQVFESNSIEEIVRSFLYGVMNCNNYWKQTVKPYDSIIYSLMRRNRIICYYRSDYINQIPPIQNYIDKCIDRYIIDSEDIDRETLRDLERFDNDFIMGNGESILPYLFDKNRIQYLQDKLSKPNY